MISVAQDEGDSPRHGPDDLMNVPIEILVRTLARRVRRLRQFERVHAAPCFIRREKQLIRIAETAARARIRELSTFTLQLLED
jgi:hypothetical protein